MNNEKWEDYAIRTVREQRDEGDLIASFFLCSAFVEHYSKTKFYLSVTEKRPVELIKVDDKITKKMKNAVIWSKLKKIIWRMSQSRIIDMGLFVGAWNNELYSQLKKFNSERNDLAHEYEYLLKILDKDEKKVRKIIELGLSLLHNIKLGYIDSKEEHENK